MPIDLGSSQTRNDFGVLSNSLFSGNDIIRKTHLGEIESTRVKQSLMLAYVGEHPDMPYYHYVGVLAEFCMSVNLSVGGRNRKDAVSVFKAVVAQKSKQKEKDRRSD